MDDALFVRGFESIGDLFRDRLRIAPGDRAPCDALREVFALDQLHHEGVRLAALLGAVDLGDVRVVERRQRARFALETRGPIGIGGEILRQDLDRHLPPEPGIASAIDLAHAALADDGEHFVWAETIAGTERHRRKL